MSKRYVPRLLLLVAGAMVASLLSEVGLRLASYAGLYVWEHDEYTGWRGCPDAVGRSRESNLLFRLNSQGFHDREHSKEKLPNTLRIAVLGDSVAEGVEVPIEKTFSAVLERELNAHPLGDRLKVEVINFGVRGYGTAQELLALRHRVWDYAPDIVVLAFYSGNDLIDDSPVLVSNRSRPFFVHQGDKLVLDNSHLFLCSPLMRLRRWGLLHSRILQLVRDAKEALGNRSQVRDPATDQVFDEYIYSDPTDPAWQEAWRVTEELVILMRDEVTARGAKFLLVTTSTPIQVNPDRTLRVRYMNKLGVRTLFYPDLRLQALGQREGIPVLNLAPRLQTHAEQQKVFLHGFGSNLGVGHWNELGHRLAGEMIAERIRAEFLDRKSYAQR